MNTNLPVPAALAPAELLPDPLDPVAVLSALSRPLALHAGHAYAAAWPLLRLPDQTASRSLIFLRDDGLPSQPIAPADALVRLATLPPLPADRLWTTSGLTAYCDGYRPDPAAVFHALTAVFDTFIDFTHSLAPQPAMAELLAAYVLTTWFLPAFPTFGHLWILGDTGAGKSRLLHLLTRLTHLGVVVPPSAPLTALRDLAALGASLAVDNADGLFSSLTTGLTFRPGAATQRQSLFLAGARRDVLFPFRQRLTGRNQAPIYGLTHFDVFGPRLFASQLPPHHAVAARALYLPLLRSTDRARCAADPDDPAAWPVPPRALLDDLWALSLAHLAELPALVSATAAGAALVGAYFQTWHPLIAVASWLTAHGVPGLLDRLRDLALDYPRQAVDIAPQAVDRTTLTLHAIYGYVALEIAEILDANPGPDTRSRSSGQRDTRDTRSRSSGQSDTRDTLPRSSGQRDTRDTLPRSSGQGDALSDLDDPIPPLDPVVVARLRLMRYSFSASMLLTVVRGLAEHRAWDTLADNLTPTNLGQTLKQLRLKQERKNYTRSYRITLPELERLIDAYRLPLPPLLTVYRRFRKDTLLASLPPGSPGAPLSPPSPDILAVIARFLNATKRSEPPK